MYTGEFILKIGAEDRIKTNVFVLCHDKLLVNIGNSMLFWFTTDLVHD